MLEGTITMQHRLGRGRSAVVYAATDEHGQPLAQKIFVGDRVANALLYLTLGAPNPYTWNEDAIACASIRRALLETLCSFWFESSVDVAGSLGHAWNESHRAHELRVELIDGRHAALRQPFNEDQPDEIRELYRDVLQPLQRRLIEAGCDGLLWQAGLGNPVAVGNFMRYEASRRWVWIDLESGIPPLLPMNPLRLLSFYLPRSIAQRRLLFDDVNIKKLDAYLQSHHQALLDRFGAERIARLHKLVRRLEKHQLAWRSLPRVQRSIGYRLSQGDIDADQAAWYSVRPMRWYALESRRLMRKVIDSVPRLGRRIFEFVRRFDAAQFARSLAAFLASQRFRARLARRYVAMRLQQWQQRRQLTTQQAGNLRRQLLREDSGSYITDFGVHIAIKPLVKITQYIILPTLFAAGAISAFWLALAIITLGAVGRTLYTTGRLVQATLTRQERPWVALVVGLMPIVGNLAYPLQLLYSGNRADRALARFIVYDTLTLTGQMIPIWGGCDTGVEHFFNRIAARIVNIGRKFSKRQRVAGGKERAEDEVPVMQELYSTGGSVHTSV